MASESAGCAAFGLCASVCFFRDLLLAYAARFEIQCSHALCLANLCRYALDFIVERKSCPDLYGSITTNRMDSQRYRLERCGLKNVGCIVEGSILHLDGQWGAMQGDVLVLVNIVVFNTIKHHENGVLWQGALWNGTQRVSTWREKASCMFVANLGSHMLV